MDRLRTRRVMGFSLIELLVVIAIILIIMGMALPQLANAKMQALELGALKAISTIHTYSAGGIPIAIRPVCDHAGGVRAAGERRSQCFWRGLD